MTITRYGTGTTFVPEQATTTEFVAAMRALISVLDGTNIDLSYDPSTGVISASITGTLAKANQHAQTAYKDEGNTFSSRQNFTAGATIGAVSGSLGQITSASGNTTGFFLIGRAGVTYCMALMNDAGAVICRTANGTQNMEFLSAVTIGGTLDHNGAQAGFRGTAPVNLPAAITQTYATADRTHAARTAAALTDNTAGTPVTTLAALPDLADSPASADALRDDLMTNWAPLLRNWAASLADQTNKGRVDALDSSQLLNSVVDDLQLQGLEG